MMNRMAWLLCPVCGNKTRLKVCQDTELINFPLYCPKCKQETLVNDYFTPRDPGLSFAQTH